MKVEPNRTKEKLVNKEDSSLYEQFQKAKPLFGSKDEARSVYMRELEQLASTHRMSIEELIRAVDETDGIPADVRRQALRLSNLISALAK